MIKPYRLQNVWSMSEQGQKTSLAPNIWAMNRFEPVAPDRVLKEQAHFQKRTISDSKNLIEKVKKQSKEMSSFLLFKIQTWLCTKKDKPLNSQSKNNKTQNPRQREVPNTISNLQRKYKN